MPTNVMAMLQSLSRAQIERLLKAKERIETLQSRRDELRKELAQIEADSRRLARGDRRRGQDRPQAAQVGERRRPRRKATAQEDRQEARGEEASLTPRSGRRATQGHEGARRRRPRTGPRGHGAPKSGGAGKRATLEDVVVSLIEKRGEPVPFQVLLSTIIGKKLFKTRSSNFDNVLRRTLSTSTRIKRVGRGIYGI